MTNELRSFIIEWNNNYPLDRQFRTKYNIAFNSETHRKINQLDILSEYIENKLIEEYEIKIEKEQKQKQQFQKGIWLSEKEVTTEDTLDLFDRIDISSIGSDSKIQIED